MGQKNTEAGFYRTRINEIIEEIKDTDFLIRVYTILKCYKDRKGK